MSKEKYWIKMQYLICEFRNRRISFSKMVSELEGLLGASNINDRNIKEKWYDLWMPLEIQNALTGNETKYQNVKTELNALEKFIKSQYNS